MIHNNYFSRIATPAKFSATKFRRRRQINFVAEPFGSNIHFYYNVWGEDLSQLACQLTNQHLQKQCDVYKYQLASQLVPLHYYCIYCELFLNVLCPFYCPKISLHTLLYDLPHPIQCCCMMETRSLNSSVYSVLSPCACILCLCTSLKRNELMIMRKIDPLHGSLK